MPLLVVEDQAPVQERLTAPPIEYKTSNPTQGRRLLDFCQKPFVFLCGLTFLALLIQGYHPYVDDAAIYLAGIEKVIHPSFFPLHAEYVLPHLKHSLFSYALGWLVRVSHIPLGFALFASYLTSLWLMLFACWRLTCLLFSVPQARWGAILLIAATLTLPVAGTAIFVIDPYLTARSFSTPVTLLAIVYALERRMLVATLCLLGAFMLHPLMATYAVGYILILTLLRGRRWRWLGTIAVGVMLIGLAASHAGTLLGGSPSYRIAAMSRSYFFLGDWAWFEIFGLFPPLIAALIYLSRRNFHLRSNYSLISATSLYVGVLAVVFALCFTRNDNSFLLARLQVLRVFQIIYILFFLLLGSLLGERILRRRWWAWTGGFTAIAALMFTVQLSLYPALKHLEWPWGQSHNPWAQAFLWIRGNTPNDAYFALDPRYQELPKEDTLGFRAMAQRSALPDWNKDGGVAAIDPALAKRWWADVSETKNFSQWTDQQRVQNLTPYGVTWIVLPAGAATQFACPYSNSAVRVCQLPADLAALSATSPAPAAGRR